MDLSSILNMVICCICSDSSIEQSSPDKTDPQNGGLDTEQTEFHIFWEIQTEQIHVLL